jgi:hypothetical protein
MNHPRRFVLLATVALFVGLGCQLADLFADKPTPPPVSPPSVRTVVVPTAGPITAPTVPRVAPVQPSPILTVAASPTEPPASPTTQVILPTQTPPSQSSTCTNPNAAITSLAMDGTVSGLIEIRGTATRPDMQYWKVEYRTETDTTYTALNNSTTAVTDGVLARWSTKTVPNGTYFVRLVIVLKDGNFATPCEIRIKIAN